MPRPGQEPSRVFELERVVAERRHVGLVLYAERRARPLSEPIATPRGGVA